MNYRWRNITIHTMEPHDKRVLRRMITENLAARRPVRAATWLG